MEEVSAELQVREGIVNYVQKRHIGGLADRTWHMQCVKRESVGNTLLLPRAKMLLVPMNFTLAGRLCSGGFYVFTEQMCIIFVACFLLRGRDTHIGFGRFVSGPHDLPHDDDVATMSHNRNKNRNSLRATSPFNASVKSNYAHPPPFPLAG